MLAALLVWMAGAGRFRLTGSSFFPAILGRPKLTAGAVTLALCGVLNWVEPAAPLVHDEFAYLLAADTFASGRLTNPTPPAWEHFESFHTIVRPTYQAKYPPGQGLFLAAGRLLTGYPIVGVWLSMSLAAMALVWMLESWVSPGWALLGGLLPVLRFGSIGNWNGPEWAMWTNSYWGGGVALLGGALLFGAARRIAEQPRARDGLLLGLGFAILANTRPYEGLVASAVVGTALLARGVWKQGFRRLAPPLALCAVVLAAAGAGMLTYNQAVTGDPFKMPYQVYYDQYEMTPQLSFLPPKPIPPDYRHEVFRRYALEFQVSSYIEAKTTGAIKEKDVRLLLSFFLGPALLLTLLLGVLSIRDYWSAVALAAILLSITAHLFVATSHYFPHYLAPVVPALLTLVILGWRRLAAWSPRGRPAGAAAAALLFVVCVGTFALATTWRTSLEGAWLDSYAVRRAVLADRLSRVPGKHLVVVDYQSGHDIHHEWVYNGADLSSAKIVWARAMGLDQDRDLLQAFAGRQAWLLDPDAGLLTKYNLGGKR